MVVVKLNEKYANDFLTTIDGNVFYRKNNSIGKEENTNDVDASMHENSVLIEQGILVVVKDNKNSKEVMNNIKNKIDSKSEGIVSQERKDEIEAANKSLEEAKIFFTAQKQLPIDKFDDLFVVKKIN